MRTALFAIFLAATAAFAQQEVASNSIPRPQVGVSHLDAKDFVATKPVLANVPAERKTFALGWKLSVLALIAGNVIDAQSSWGHLERNAAISSSNGRFGGRALAYKAAGSGSLVAMEAWYLHRTNGKGSKTFAVANFILGGTFAAAGAYNHSIQH